MSKSFLELKLFKCSPVMVADIFFFTHGLSFQNYPLINICYDLGGKIKRSVSFWGGFWCVSFFFTQTTQRAEHFLVQANRRSSSSPAGAFCPHVSETAKGGAVSPIENKFRKEKEKENITLLGTHVFQNLNKKNKTTIIIIMSHF